MQPEASQFGPFVIIQLAVAAVIGVGAMVALWRGSKSRATGSDGGGVQLFFDGPLNKALGSLEGIYRMLIEIRNDNEKHAGAASRENDRLASLMDDIKDGLGRLNKRR